ncbi:cobalt-precorrin-6A reductase [uncultured Corynebacterium sp.]|uniref:cobalt-precorrin-6A reductase n=1 Tax=uncultured Corynebacterium sp. TaxID=159447 RepID=UPI0025E497A6|nr:cobalt-precorrin-6A reductase [uncultured Corynebacterium sp.]
MRALILGGTNEARALAQKLFDAGWHVTSSLAGRVAEPTLPVGHVRIGGFGGPAGLTTWLLTDATEVIVDATHPFAERISASAAEAARATGLPLVALHRPPWEPERGDHWLEVPDMAAAAELARTRFAAPFLTVGRQQLAHFAADGEGRYLIRCVEQPTGPLPRHRKVLLTRGPFDVAGERKLMRDYAVDCLVTKNSGGTHTHAKLEAARDLRKPVIMVQRPELPGKGIAYVADTVERAYAAVTQGRV